MSKKSFSVVIRAIIKKMLKPSKVGRLIYPFAQKMWRSVVIPMRRRRLQKHGIDVLDRLHKVLTANGISYYCDFGTLLGIVRDNRLIPHDDDIDISIPQNQENTPQEIARVLLNAGYEFLHGLEYDGKLRIFTVIDKTGISIDFFVICPATKPGYRYGYGIEWHEDTVYPSETANSVVRVTSIDAEHIVPYDLHGATVSIPSDAEARLISTYGEHWRKPIKDYTEQRKVEVLPGFSFRLSEAEFFAFHDKKNSDY